MNFSFNVQKSLSCFETPSVGDAICEEASGDWIEPVAERVLGPTGELIWSSMRIVKRQR
jgi:hypothetical protein